MRIISVLSIIFGFSVLATSMAQANTLQECFASFEGQYGFVKPASATEFEIVKSLYSFQWQVEGELDRMIRRKRSEYRKALNEVQNKCQGLEGIDEVLLEVELGVGGMLNEPRPAERYGNPRIHDT